MKKVYIEIEIFENFEINEDDIKCVIKEGLYNNYIKNYSIVNIELK